jgi:hypothetical protein
MLFREIIAVYSENHTKILSYWLLKQAVHIVAIVLLLAKNYHHQVVNTQETTTLLFARRDLL